MLIILRLITIILINFISIESYASEVRADNWWQEDQNQLYYYISVPTTDANLKKFYDLVLYHGWKIDISGMNASANIQARLVKDPSNQSDGDHPFPQDKSWYDNILFRSSDHVSYKLTGTMAEQITFTNSMIKKGYREGFMSADTPAFTQTITFYR